MKFQRSVVAAVLLLATCNDDHHGNSTRPESSRAALGVLPAGEIATWTFAGPPLVQAPVWRFLQSAAFDETRKVLMMFGGLFFDYTVNNYQASPELWEWDPATGLWTNRRPTPPGDKPYRRAGAGMVFDSVRNKLVIFGGRTTNATNYAEIWDWDLASGFSDRTGSDLGPAARSQHGMVFEKSTGNVLVFGGGVAQISSLEPTGRADVSVAFGDTWEWNPSTGKWTELQPKSAPSARYDSTLVWDSKRNVAVLFGGMERAQAGTNGVPKQDTWEWDPATASWTNWTRPGPKPSVRYGHAMAYDPGRGVIVLAGGWDIDTGDGLADVWEWDPTAGTWTERLTGSEANLPPARMYASLVTDSSQNHLDLIGGQAFHNTNLPAGEIWELVPATASFTDRTPVPPKGWPIPRTDAAMAFCLATGKTYVFGGGGDYETLDDLSEWDGTSWASVAGDVRPAGRRSAAMAYDPFRTSLILFGGQDQDGNYLGDTWEWSSATRKWTQLYPKASPEPRYSHGMVTDSGRAKVLLFGGEIYCDSTVSSGTCTPNQVWEWDGPNTTWTNRTTVQLTRVPEGRVSPLLSFDEGRQKMFLFGCPEEGTHTYNSVFWEWDPVSAGWSLRGMADDLNVTCQLDVTRVVYDSRRHRQILIKSPDYHTAVIDTWELDTEGPTLYKRVVSSGPVARTGEAVAFDRQRGVVVLFGGSLTADPYLAIDETWEYKVTNLGNGEACTPDTASTCASGFCVGGVCCKVALCAGACQSCGVVGHEGTCAAAGPETGSGCEEGQACDGSGNCKAKNGTACSSAVACASGFCVDGVCCESACTDTCVSCNQAGRAGKCSAYAVGSDPEKECSPGSGLCRLVCNGAGSCDAPPSGMPCGRCTVCDGLGSCVAPDPPLCSTDAGAGGSGGTGAGGAGGSSSSGFGGAGGTIAGGRGGASSLGGTSTVGGAVSGGVGGSSSPGGNTATGGAGGAVASTGLDAGAGADGSGGTRGASASPDGGKNPVPPDAGSPDRKRNSVGIDASPAQLHRAGCSCDLGQNGRRTPGLPLALFGGVLLCRRLRRRQTDGPQSLRNSLTSRLALVGLVVLLLLANCSEKQRDTGIRLESAHAALGTVPATESAVWTRIGAPTSPTPNPRYLQAAAFDESRNVLVMFGGWSGATSDYNNGAAIQDLWEWDPATGLWTNRTPAGSNKPSARAGASMVYDPTHRNFVIFGGRSTTGFDYEDTWEWDPGKGAFTDRSTTGPSARSQHSMVFEKSTGKVLLFGGGFADAGSSLWPEDFSYTDPTARPRPGRSVDGTGISLAVADTWEWDPSQGTWTQVKITNGPSARYDSGLIWDSQRSRAVLFGGMRKDEANADGVPQQDIWEWDPAAPGWTLRSTTGQMPTARWGHAMAYDSSRGMVVLAGGKDFQTHLGLADVWDWNPSTRAWAQRLDGSEANLPAGRMYASLVADSAGNRLDLLAGATFYPEYPADANGQPYPAFASAEVWELQTASATFTNRSALQNAPSNRQGHAIAFCPATGKTYMFGGYDDRHPMLDDLWEWDGTSWVQIPSDVRPLARYWAAMAYDPFRKSLILYGGESIQLDNSTLDLADSWEWQSGTRKWSQLFPKSSPGPQGGPSMVTDTGRGKVLLLTVDNPSVVWEWDGAGATWTNRTPVQDTRWPSQSWSPLVAFDDGRQKMILFDNATYGQGTRSSAFWEWDPISAGWAPRNSGDFIDLGSNPFPVLAYDSLRRRQVLPTNATTTTSPTAPVKTWELDANGPTWYRRDLSSSPASLTSAAMAFDSQRGVMVLFGAGPYDGSNLSETWEYKVSNLGNGQGCTAATATSCASGFCADGVCCAVAACPGTCQSCAVAGHEGTCAPVVAGTEVPGSCATGQACDSSGGCKAKNGTACSGAGACASGICVDGVCCESACDGLCSSCNQASRAGKCSAYALGTDPELECGVGDGACRTTCNGAGACDYPQGGTACGTCRTCDGSGSCSDVDPSQCGTGGAAGSGGAGGTGAGVRAGRVAGAGWAARSRAAQVDSAARLPVV